MNKLYRTYWGTLLKVSSDGYIMEYTTYWHRCPVRYKEEILFFPERFKLLGRNLKHKRLFK